MKKSACKKKLQFGKCHICQGIIDVPGLDASRCLSCGWIGNCIDWQADTLKPSKNIDIEAFQLIGGSNE